MASDKQTLRPPPPLGHRGPGRAGPGQVPGPGPAVKAATPDAGRAPARPVAAVPMPPGAGKSEASPGVPSSPRLGAGVVVPSSTGAKVGAVKPAIAAPSGAQASAPVRRRVGQGSITARAASATAVSVSGGAGRKAEIAPGSTVRGLNRPHGVVRSNPQVAEIVRAAQALVDVLEAENAALRRHDVDGVRALTERKEKTTHLYRDRMMAMHKDPGIITGLPAEERDAVRDIGVYLDAHLAENARLLKSVMEGTNLLMGLIVDALNEANGERAPGYAPDGRLSDAAHNPSRVTLTYNENL